MPRSPTNRIRVAQAPPRIAARDTRAVPPPPKTADPFYLSQPWRKLLARLLAERGRRCERCGRTRDQHGAIRIFGDHIVELRDGGAALDPRNCQLLCGACHTTKTLAERAKRLADRPTEVVV